MPGILPASLTLRMFYIDQETELVLKMQFTRYADNAPSSGFMTEMYFSNYQPVNGLMFPMKIDSYFDSKPVSPSRPTTTGF